MAFSAFIWVGPRCGLKITDQELKMNDKSMSNVLMIVVKDLGPHNGTWKVVCSQNGTLSKSRRDAGNFANNPTKLGTMRL